MAKVGGRRRRERPLEAHRIVPPAEAIVDVREIDVRGPNGNIDLTAAATALLAGDPRLSPRRRILIVDDEPDVLGWLRPALEPLRWDVNGARNASDGLEMAVRLLPDVVLLDQQLPDGSGIEIGRWLHTNQPAMRLVMFSAYLDLATEHEAERLGITTISKVDVHALHDTLAAIRAELDAQVRSKV